MQIEKVVIKKTLKAGQDVWLEGVTLQSPLPPEILQEVYLGTGTVEVLESQSGSQTDSTRPVVQEPVFKDQYKNDPFPRTATTVDVKERKKSVRRARRLRK